MKHTPRAGAAPTFPSPGNRLTFRSLNGVTSHSCHGLPSCQFSAFYELSTPFRSRVRFRHGTDGQRGRRTDNSHQCIMPHLWGRGHNKNNKTVARWRSGYGAGLAINRSGGSTSGRRAIGCNPGQVLYSSHTHTHRPTSVTKQYNLAPA